ncbi:globin family protein [Brevibacterium rongguiense]|uniref:hypothetical protein n=1 Tax=Brevibacterium rongguiense TaxID=2695267 RepID=UPI002E2E77F6|nr:hypothetical protein [Brevibacterium rongguiense]
MTTTLPGLRPIERTQLSQEHADTIRATLPLVGSKIDEITPLFYSTMFERHPELIDNLFNRGNQKQGAQQRALAASVATFAAALVNESVPDPRDLLERIGTSTPRWASRRISTRSSTTTCSRRSSRSWAPMSSPRMWRRPGMPCTG